MSPRTVYFFLSHMYDFLISKWDGYKLPGTKQFFCGFRGLYEGYGLLQSNSKTNYRTQAGPRQLLFELASLWPPVILEVRVSSWKMAISHSTALAVGINRSTHILSIIASLHPKIFHASSLSVSALQSKKVCEMTSNWYFQTLELGIPQLNLGLLNTPYINYIKLQEFKRT